jgi:hypothetical protein
MNRLFYALLFFLVTSSASVFAETANNPSAEEATIVFEGTTVTYSGKITDKNIERFLDTVNGKKVSVLIIASSGGEVNAGMIMGEWVFDNHVDIVVERMCMSSCANYVFTAGRHKTINENSIVAWHGSILQEFGMSDEDVRAAVIESYSKLPEREKKKNDVEVLVSQSIRQMREYRMSTMARQEQFFRKIGVDEYICRVGNEKYGAKDFFVLSVKDMARFGVLDVHAPENYQKTDLTPFREKGRSVEFINLH